MLELAPRLLTARRRHTRRGGRAPRRQQRRRVERRGDGVLEEGRRHFDRAAAGHEGFRRRALGQSRGRRGGLGEREQSGLVRLVEARDTRGSCILASASTVMSICARRGSVQITRARRARNARRRGRRRRRSVRRPRPIAGPPPLRLRAREGACDLENSLAFRRGLSNHAAVVARASARPRRPWRRPEARHHAARRRARHRSDGRIPRAMRAPRASTPASSVGALRISSTLALRPSSLWIPPLPRRRCRAQRWVRSSSVERPGATRRMRHAGDQARPRAISLRRRSWTFAMGKRRAAPAPTRAPADVGAAVSLAARRTAPRCFDRAPAPR